MNGNMGKFKSRNQNRPQTSLSWMTADENLVLNDCFKILGRCKNSQKLIFNFLTAILDLKLSIRMYLNSQICYKKHKGSFWNIKQDFISAK